MDEIIAFRVADQLEESARLLRALATALREARSKLPPAPALDLPVKSLGVRVRVRKAFWRLGIETIGDLVKASADDFLATKNFGFSSLFELKEALAERGLCLRGDELFLRGFKDGRAPE